MVFRSTSGPLPQKPENPPIARSKSFWVILGYLFWFGFYIGAMIMREVAK